MIDQHMMSRLAFLRYGYLLATEQAQQPEPMCAHALLGLHDAVELYLQVAAENLNAPSQPKQFLEFWSVLSPLMSTGQLSHKIGMERVNKARVNLKHYGNLPSMAQIQEFQSITASFFEENTPVIFGITFDSISLVDLVENDSARETLRRVESLMASGDLATAMGRIAVAFRQLIDSINDGYYKRYYKSPFGFEQDFKFDSAFFRRPTVMPGDPKREAFEDKLIAAIESMQPVAQSMALGLDYRKYAKFSLMVPAVHRVLGGEYRVQVVRGLAGSIDWPPTHNAVQYCFDFVIESAIKMRGVSISEMPH